jgi:hypothetical protein
VGPSLSVLKHHHRIALSSIRRNKPQTTLFLPPFTNYSIIPTTHPFPPLQPFYSHSTTPLPPTSSYPFLPKPVHRRQNFEGQKDPFLYIFFFHTIIQTGLYGDNSPYMNIFYFSLSFSSLLITTCCLPVCITTSDSCTRGHERR